MKKTGRMMLIYAALCIALFFGFRYLPSSFLPEEDQGYFITSMQLPFDATLERTAEAVGKYEAIVADRAGIDRNLSILGFSFAGSGSNSALAFTLLKDWDQRNGATAEGEAAWVQQAMEAVPDAMVMSLLPPPISELGNSSGFTLQLEDRGGHDYKTQTEALNGLLAAAAGSKVLAGVYPDGLPDGTSINLSIDREKAEAMGVSFSDISETLSGAMGSTYVNDFPNSGRIQQVIVQADAPWRMQLESVLSLYVRNASGGMVPLAEFVKGEWQSTPLQLLRYQGYPAFRIAGGPAPGYSTGQAMEEMEKLAAQLPSGFTIEWTGQSLQERDSAAQAPMLMLLSMLVVFLVLAALYESWSIPLAVMLVVPLGLAGTVSAVLIREMSNDVFFKVGMITIIGLSAKNAILIIEFAKHIYEQEGNLVASTLKAAKMRLRPILMTSLAFTLGVVPLMLATGASATTQHAIGTGVFGGMISGTLLAIIFVPAFFIVVMSLKQKVGQRLHPKA